VKQVITILLIVAAIWVAKEIQSYWETVKAKQLATQGGAPAAQAPPPSALSGLPASLEASLETAKKQGPASVKTWLKSYRIHATDPRLAAIELDYVVSLPARDIKEAREVFAAVKARTPTNSPVYSRIKQLSKTYQ
jgi:hypothetical protein